MESEARSIKENALKLSWYMRGGITYTDILNLAPYERETIVKLIESNMETTKKTGLPYF